jgi:hypothetical protein
VIVRVWIAISGFIGLVLLSTPASADHGWSLEAIRATSHLFWLGIVNQSEQSRQVCARRVFFSFRFGGTEHWSTRVTLENVCPLDSDKHEVLPKQHLWWLAELGSESDEFGALSIRASFPLVILDQGAEANTEFVGDEVNLAASAPRATHSAPAWSATIVQRKRFTWLAVRNESLDAQAVFAVDLHRLGTDSPFPYRLVGSHGHWKSTVSPVHLVSPGETYIRAVSQLPNGFERSQYDVALWAGRVDGEPDSKITFVPLR